MKGEDEEDRESGSDEADSAIAQLTSCFVKGLPAFDQLSIGFNLSL